jgi:DNA replication and repair protein RecF
MRPLAVGRLGIRAFRNLADVDVDLGPRLNVVWGDNGQGKTNLLEAVYALATSRSFRTAKLTDLVQSGADTASVRGVVVEDGDVREQSLGLRKGVRLVRVDGKRPETLAAYAVRTPTVVFHPAALALSSGGGSERRKLLDRLSLYLSPASLDDVDSYGRALRARQRVLDMRGETAPDLDAWEDLVAKHGAAVSAAREDAVARLLPAAARAYARIGPPGVTFRGRYERTAPSSLDAYRAELTEVRRRDRARGSATLGPHRDDLVLELGDHPVRGIASQGQHRAVVLALQLAEIDVIAASRDVRPVLLLDDVSSELDEDRTSSLFAALTETPSQIVLTTTRRELIDTQSAFARDARRDFRMLAGQIAAG